MGNCFTSSKILNDQDELPGCNQANQVIKETGKVAEAAEVGGDGVKIKMKKKKVVRFKLNGEKSVDGSSGKQGESKNGVVRIRLVVTQEELKQILSSSRKDLKQSSMEQLIRVMKLRGARVSEAGGRTSSDDVDGCHGAWRPALESIPEEH